MKGNRILKQKTIVLYQKWTNLNPFNFIIVTSLLMIILTIPIVIVIEALEISDNEIGGIDLDKYGIVEMAFMVLIFAPILETLLSQQIPILLTQRFIRYKPNLIGVLLSAIIFSIMHINYSIWYALLMLPSGLLLASTFILFQKRNESSFLITTTVHLVRNLIPFVMVMSERHWV